MSGMSGGGMAKMMQNMQAMMQEKFEMADTDASGGISQTELETLSEDGGRMGGKLLENFGKIDSDENGELSETEIQGFFSEKMSAKMSDMSSMGGGFGGLSAGAGSTNTLLDMLSSLNEDDDSSSTSLSDLFSEKISSSGLSDSMISQLLSKFDSIEEQLSSFSSSA